MFYPLKKFGSPTPFYQPSRCLISINQAGRDRGSCPMFQGVSIRRYWIPVFSKVASFLQIVPQTHGLWTSKEIRKFGPIWQTKYASAIPKNLGVGVNFGLSSEGDFLTGRPQSVLATIRYIEITVQWQPFFKYVSSLTFLLS